MQTIIMVAQATALVAGALTTFVLAARMARRKQVYQINTRQELRFIATYLEEILVRMQEHHTHELELRRANLTIAQLEEQIECAGEEEQFQEELKKISEAIGDGNDACEKTSDWI